MKRLLRIVALLLAALPAASAEALTVEKLAQEFSSPVYLTAPAGDSRLFVVEKAGQIKLLTGSTVTTFLDIRGKVDSSGGEEGLLSVAFPPGYGPGGLFYVYYTAEVEGGVDGSDLVVEEHRSNAAGTASAGATGETLRIPHRSFSNHNGGQLQFGPDGSLWIGTGDGGGGNDPQNNAQRTSSSLGKLLRVTPRPGGGFSASGNPFAERPELWAIGLRNPWRFSFDRATGDLLIGDVGQNAAEEVDIARARDGLGCGANFGWSRFEGTIDRRPAEGPLAAYIAPLLTHTHDSGWSSITGGYVIRDPALAEQGKYVYGDVGLQRLRVVDPATGAIEVTEASVPTLVSFGEDGQGRVHAVSLEGGIYRLESDTGTNGTAPAPARFAVPGCGTNGAPPPGPSAPSPSGGRGGPQADRTAPRLVVSAKRRQRGLRKRYVHLRVKCLERCGLSVSGSLVRRGRNAGLKRVRRTLRRGRAATVRVKIGARGRRLARRSLRRGQRVTLRLVLRATDAAGNTRRRVVRIRVVR